MTLNTALFSWRKAALLVFFLSLYVPLNWPMTNYNVNVSDILFWGLLIFFAAHFFLVGRTRLKIFDGRLLSPVAVLVCYAVLQAFFVESPFRVGAALYRISQVALLVFFLSGGNFIGLARRDIRMFLRVFYYFSLIGAAIAVVYAITTGKRFYGIWSVWFVFGSLPYGFYYCLYRLIFLKKQRLLAYLSLFLFLWAVMLSRTRGLWLTIPISCAVILLAHGRRRRRTWRFKNILLLLICLAEIIFIGAGSREIKDRGVSIFTGEQKRDARLYRWKTSLRVFLDHPMGVGLGNNRYYTLDYAIETSPDYNKVLKLRQASSEVSGPRYGAHSDWFTLLAEAGLLGVFFYAWFWGIILREIWQRSFRRIDVFVVGTFLFTLFINTFLGSVFLASGGGMEIIFFYYFLRRLAPLSSQKVSFAPSTEMGAHA